MLIAHTETARLNPNIVTRVRERSGRSNFQSVTKPGLTTIVRLIHHCLCLSSGVLVCVHPMREFPPEDKCVGVIVCNPWLSPALTADLHKCGRPLNSPRTAPCQTNPQNWARDCSSAQKLPLGASNQQFQDMYVCIYFSAQKTFAQMLCQKWRCLNFFF